MRSGDERVQIGHSPRLKVGCSNLGKHSTKLLGAILSLASAGLATSSALAQAPNNTARGSWVGSWASPPTDLLATIPSENPSPYEAVTIRSALRLSAGGNAIRVRFSNDLGKAPVTINAASVGLTRRKGLYALQFNGENAVTIGAGQSVFSDPLTLRVQPRSELSVSIYVAGPYPRLTGHAVGQEMVWRAPGNQTMSKDLVSALPGFSRLLLSQVDVHTDREDAGTIAIVGDSITEGYLSTFDARRRWPDYLIAGTPTSTLARLGIVNLGISGNRLLQDVDGTALVRRLDRDVWSVPHVRTLVMLIGVNDLGYPLIDGSPFPTFAQMQTGYRQVISSAHTHGANVVGATIMPYAGYGPSYHAMEGEVVRQAVNEWIRTSGEFDAVVDLDRACAANHNPLNLSSECDGGDGLHPSDRGYALMAAEVARVLWKNGLL